ncbi:arylsulfatase [Crateriforma conspicua]|nr:arylsulfatase [Crateriforma conspicua]
MWWLAAAVCLTAVSSVAAEDRPNVLLIMADDQGWGDVTLHGNDVIETPTMDALARSGAQFDRFYACPMCGPTRAALLTGRWNLRSGASWVSHGKEIVRLDETTIGDVFSNAGYATGAFGKWHNGEYGPYHPNARGFDQFVGFCRGAWENYFDAVIERNRQPLQTKGYITDVLTDAAIDFMEANRDRPFLCYVPYNAPHHPFQVPKKYFDKYRQRTDSEKMAAVYGMVENIDDNLARLLATLDELEIADNTIVIYTSDNGPAQPRYNGGMRGIKASVDEGGTRVPMFVRYPGHVPPGTIVKPIASHIDLLPTLASWCDVPFNAEKPIDGKDLTPLLEGKRAEWPDRMVFTHQNRLGETMMTPGGVRTEQYRLVHRGPKGDGYELYDMLADPGQAQDIADDQPEVTTRLMTAYEAWYREVTTRGTDPPPLPVGYEPADETALQAEDARLSDGLQFYRKQGWAHDSILNWTSSDDTATWQIDVLQEGTYEIELMIGCGPQDLGATVTVNVANQSVTAKLTTPHEPLPALEKGKDRNAIWTSGPVPTMTWLPLELPSVQLETGIQVLRVSVDGIEAGSRFELKEVRLCKR